MFDAFFAYALEREKIRQCRLIGMSPPSWTSDPILRTYRFCNVNREHDATTVWFRKNLRDPLRDNLEKVFLATMIFRWFNRIETGKILTPMLLAGEWHERWTVNTLRFNLPKGPFFTGSYIVRSPFGQPKLEGIAGKITEAWKRRDEFLRIFDTEEGTVRLEEGWNVLRSWSFLGDFTAYEIVTDLRHTCAFEKAPDIMTWANPGPGAARGLGRIFHGDPKAVNQNQKTKLVAMMQQILAEAPKVWPSRWGPWEMRTVEHTLCEFDKYERVRLGEGRPRQVFKS